MNADFVYLYMYMYIIHTAQLLSIMPYSFYHDHLEGSPSPYEFIFNIIFSRTISRSSVKKEDLNNSQRHKNYLHDEHLIMNNLNVSTLIVFLELIVFFGQRVRCYS